MPSLPAMLASRFVWEAVGRPAFVETDGTPIKPRFADDVGCASCGEVPAPFRMDDVISDKFTTIRNNGILWPYGGDHVCQPCGWTFKTLALRCAMGFARRADEHGPGGVWFVPTRPMAKPASWPSSLPWRTERPDPLAVLLDPPPPPFVAWCPMYGIEHGGEAHVDRCYWPGSPPSRRGTLIKLQTKHCVPYAKVSHSREQYDLALDEWNITVDLALWRALREMASALLTELRAAGVGAEAARRSLLTLLPPLGAPLALVSPPTWRARTLPFVQHIHSSWWSFFVELLPMPALPGAP